MLHLLHRLGYSLLESTTRAEHYLSQSLMMITMMLIMMMIMMKMYVEDFSRTLLEPVTHADHVGPNVPRMQ